jgi:hypothetical protein
VFASVVAKIKERKKKETNIQAVEEGILYGFLGLKINVD